MESLRQYLQGLGMEECAELAQRLSKSRRFGDFETQTGHRHNNVERTREEYLDLVAVLELLDIHVTENDRHYIEQKKTRVLAMTTYSVECEQVSNEVLHQLTTRVTMRPMPTNPVVADTEKCTRCGEPASAHLLANYADGPLIGASFRVCPASTFRSIEDLRRAPQPPTSTPVDR